MDAPVANADICQFHIKMQKATNGGATMLPTLVPIWNALVASESERMVEQFRERLKSQGKTCAEVGAILGRTAGSVSMHLYERRMSPEKAQAHKEMKNRSRQRRDPVVPRSDRFLDKSIQVVNRPTPEMLADRDRREAMPHRDLTSAFFGDPPLGLSALEGRR